MFKTFFCIAAIGLLLASGASAHDMTNDKSKVTVVFDHVLPNVKGKSMKGVLVEYQPGGSSPAHTHPKSAFIYATVLKGASPSAPPICCIALRTPDPMPESSSLTPWTAVSVSGTNTKPMPNDITRIHGSRSLT